MEVWKDVPGYEGRCQVSDHGQVRFAGRIKKQYKNGVGYPCVKLRTPDGHFRSVQVHQLVLLAFIGECPPGMESCHKDGTRSNNRLSNLRWDTHVANLRDRFNHGTMTIGQANGRARLNETDVAAIRAAHASGKRSLASLARQHGVCRSTVRYVVIRKCWKHC